MGGVSGALYSLMLSGAARKFKRVESRRQSDLEKNKKLKDPDLVGMWIEALEAATLLLQKYGMVKAGDRSMVSTVFKGMRYLTAIGQ
jgi:hypothetical protein